MKNILLLSLIVLLTLISCEEKSKIDGLWIVQSVTVGEEEMTPNARWMEFHPDFTLKSGNGWFQHSVGTWELDANKLKMTNTNGFNDPYPAFEITLNANQMTWKRIEDEQPIEVLLTRSDQLPQTYGDQILGLWKLEESISRDNYFSETVNSNDYIFFRWDKRFVIGSDSNRYTGIYQVHGHRSQVVLIPNDEKVKRSNWEINFNPTGITLSKLNSDSVVTRKFTRIHDFPQ